MAESSSTLRTYLDRVLRQWRMAIALQGLGLTVTVGILVVAFSMLIDYAVGLGSLARSGLLVLCLAGMIATGVQYLMRPLRRIPSELQVARYIEEQRPELNDGFVSAVEFEGKPLDGTARRFLDQLIAQVSAQTNQIDFAHLIDRRRMRRSQGAAFTAIALLAVFAMQDVEMFGRSAVRLATPWARPGTNLSTELDVFPGDIRVRRGGNQTITAKLMGRLTPSVRLFSKRENEEEWRSVEMFETEEAGVFTYDMMGVQEHTEYHVNADPARSSDYTITVYDPPFVERIDLAYRFPSYTGLKPRTEEDKGDITAPIGSTVMLTIAASKPIASAELAFSNGQTLDLQADEKELTGRLTVREDLSYTVRMVDIDDLANENPIEYYIRALADQAPRVVITAPGRDARVSPIEEVLIEAEAEDDFGLSSFSLIYSVNGGADQTIDLAADSDKRQDTTGILWEGAHTFYLEEFSLEPGDFITYYAEARDRRGDEAKTATDMYFLDIKPFEETFRQAAGGGGGGMAGMQPGRLSQEQKEIIAATWRVERDRKQSGEEQIEKDLKAIADAQDGLRGRVEEAASMVLFQGGMDEETRQMADLLEKAAEPMEKASAQLRAGSSSDALPPEREALQYLLKLDALIREYIVTQQNNMAQNQSSAPLDQSDTSELELKRDESKYETLDQSSQTQQQSQTVDESQRRVKELARRQQQLNNEMRQLADARQRSEAERRRELDRLTREQRQLRQQAEELSRNLSQMPNQSSSPRETSQSLQQATQGLRESSEQMAQSAQQLQRNELQQASNQGAQALQRLEDVDRQLQRAQIRSLEQMVRNTVQRADQLATQQEQLARAVEELKKEQDRDYSSIKARIDALDNGRSGLTEEDKTRRVEQFVQRRLQEIAEAKDQTRHELDRLNEDLEFLAEQAAREQPEANKSIREAMRNIKDQKLADRMESSKRLLRENALDRSLQTEERLSQDLNELAEQIRTAQDNLMVPDQEQLARAQEQAREAMSDLQNLQRELNRLQRRSQQLGQEPGNGQQQALARDFQRQLDTMRDIVNQMPQNSQQAQQLRQQLSNAVSLGNEPWKFDRAEWEELSQNLGRALADVNRSLNDQLQDLIQKEKLYLAKDEEVPPQYRELVNEYYERLSKRSER